MRVVRTIAELKTELSRKKNEGHEIGFVPTMGYLHEAHLRLVDRACQENGTVVMSIFVNPLQFGPNEDFDRYPRDIERDKKLAEERGVDILFCPETKEIYPSPLSVTVQVKEGTDVLCGRHRPGHFDGVATVVLKLLHMVEPSRIYFGMKDAQQVAVIEKMVSDLNIPVTVVPCETIRENDGLAKSSRNVYLSEQERRQAPALYESLVQGAALIKEGEDRPEKVIEKVKDMIEAKTDGEIDYVELLSYPDLKPVESIEGRVIIAAALRFEKARLIDNITLEASRKAAAAY
ncbi:pantoate--beta-alanine ligase [Thalassobacillus sp. C254]|uniref:pantoate--beta-alanine ligase n=1 Tax=Thalassobacillus sp. C254 TaxID=1225341 RepID=UPI0006D22359|nr:pantoate--beta-alanine ligase [Thalassobacillus sp. C254]